MILFFELIVIVELISTTSIKAHQYSYSASQSSSDPGRFYTYCLKQHLEVHSSVFAFMGFAF